MKPQARYLMIGGFLGAGKTTSIAKFAESFHEQGLRVGLITNDQGNGLVDSALARSRRFPVEEIAGGCFCCRFNSLVDAARNLSTANRPDVFLAEPVGSCTDLVATVSLPLHKIYGDDYTVAPLSVVVDPRRARRVLGLEEGRQFSENVRYIYLKQLEEAEVIVINKTDLVTPEELSALREALAERCPHAAIFSVSARQGDGLDAWLAHILENQMNVSRFMDVDYDQYADGEALLGWLNATVEITHPDGDEFDGNVVIAELAAALQTELAGHDVEIAHLKMTLSPLGDPLEVAAVNLVASENEPELSHRLVDPLEDGELLINMRCEADPDVLDTASRTALARVLEEKDGLTFRETHREHFRPSPPRPTHRYTAIS